MAKDPDGSVEEIDELSPGRHIAILGSRGYPSSYGGFETLVRHLAPYLAQRGHRVVVFGRKRGGQYVDEADRPSADVTSVDTWGLETKSLSTLTHGFTSAVAARRTRPSFDAALVVNTANGYFLPVLKRRNIRTVVNVDGLEWERGKWGGLARSVFWHGARLSARYADVLVADSRSLQPYWSRTFARDTTFIPYGGDDDGPVAPASALADFGLTPKAYALVVARLVPENNVEMIVDAFSAATSPWPLVVVGSANYSSPSVEHLRSLAVNQPQRVRLLGHVRDQRLLRRLWASCGVYLHGHSVGGTNPALLQAMGLGAPVVAYRSPYNLEVLRGDDWLFASSSELSSRLAAAFSWGPEQRLAREATSRRLVEEHYRWASVCAQYEAALVGRGTT